LWQIQRLSKERRTILALRNLQCNKEKKMMSYPLLLLRDKSVAGIRESPMTGH
jgi:hypothetical protein